MKLTENPAKNRLLARLIAFILFLFLLLLSSCKTTSNTTAIVPVHSATHDTILLSKVKYDSIYIDRWQRIERKADTVFYDRVKTEFRYRLLRDTVYKTRTDTVPVVKQVRALHTAFHQVPRLPRHHRIRSKCYCFAGEEVKELKELRS